MDADQVILRKGMVVRCSNEDNSVNGVVAEASANGCAVVVNLEEVIHVRAGGGIVITAALPLTIDYESNSVVDWWNNDWHISFLCREGATLIYDKDL